MRGLPGQARGQGCREYYVIIYSALPYLLVMAPAVIVLLAVLIGGCTMTADDPIDSAGYYANSRAGAELTQELDRHAAREDLRRTVEEGQRWPSEAARPGSSNIGAGETAL